MKLMYMSKHIIFKRCWTYMIFNLSEKLKNRVPMYVGGRAVHFIV